MGTPLGYFIPDRDPPGFYPLASFLQSPPASVAEKYIAAFSQPGDLIIDPFACKPTLARLALQMGRRAILFDHNPLWAWLARAMATVPNADEINATFARLGDAVKDDVPLRTHITQLYATRCVECNQLTPADYFLHRRDEGPLQRHYTCANCGAIRDDPATPDDLERANAFDAKGFHYHLAFQRVVPAENLHADRIRKMLDLYTPRNLYALVTITTKSDTLFRVPEEKQILALLLLHLLDRGASFYADPGKPAQLTRHKQFVEFNLWREMEYAAQNLAKAQGASQGYALAESPRAVTDTNEPRVWTGWTSAKKLASEIPAGSVRLVIASPPSRRPAIWALSYFWGAWTLNRATVQSLVQFLDSQTTDITWQRHWYLESICASMNALDKALAPDARVVFIFDETSSERMETVLLATSCANMQLETLLFQPRLGDHPRREFDSMPGSYRIGFTHKSEDGGTGAPPLPPTELKSMIHTVALAAGREVLTRRGEPLGFPWLHHAAYANVARDGLLGQAMRSDLKAAPGRFVFQAVQDGLVEGYAHDFDHYEGEDQFLWFRRAKTEPPLIDRVQQAVQEIVARGEIACIELEDEIYKKFAGDLTPEAGLIDLVAQAYADKRADKWVVRQEDLAAERAQAYELLKKLGQRLEYETGQNQKPFDWVWKQGGNVSHGFVWRDAAAFADLARIHTAPTRGYLIVPESQVALLTERSKRSPHITEMFYDAGWGFVRIPFMAKLLESETIDQNDIALMAGLVPLIAQERAQLELF